MIIKPELNPTWSDNAVEWTLTKIFIPIDWVWDKLGLPPYFEWEDEEEDNVL